MQLEGESTPTTDNDISALEQDAGGDESAAPEAGNEEPTTGGQTPDPTQAQPEERVPTRRELKAQRGKIFERNKELERLLAEERAERERINQKLIETMNSMKQSFDESRPKPKSAKEQALEAYRQRVRETFAAMDSNDPSSIDKFVELIAEGGRIGSMDLVEEKVNEVKGAIPPPKSPLAAKLEAEFPWLDDDDNKDLVNSYARRLANTKYKGRDVRGDQNLAYAVLREAAALVAKHHEMPVATPPDPNAQRRLAGTSGRNGAPGAGAGGGPGFDAETLARIDAAAAALWPSADMTLEQKRAKWISTMRKNQPDVYKAIVGA